jgi:hypothetical protein
VDVELVVIALLPEAEVVGLAEEVDVALAADVVEEEVLECLQFPLGEVEEEDVSLLGSQHDRGLVVGHAEGVDEVAELVPEEEVAVAVVVEKQVLADALLGMEDDRVFVGGDQSVDFENFWFEIILSSVLEDHEARGNEGVH